MCLKIFENSSGQNTPRDSPVCNLRCSRLPLRLSANRREKRRERPATVRRVRTHRSTQSMTFTHTCAPDTHTRIRLPGSRRQQQAARQRRSKTQRLRRLEGEGAPLQAAPHGTGRRQRHRPSPMWPHVLVHDVPGCRPGCRRCRQYASAIGFVARPLHGGGPAQGNLVDSSCRRGARASF